MPFVPSSPETKQVIVPTDKTLDRFHVDEIHIFIDHDTPGNNVLSATWSKGYVENEVYVKAEPQQTHYAGAALNALMSQVTLDGETMYAAVKRAVWQALIDDGHVPEGSVV